MTGRQLHSMRSPNRVLQRVPGKDGTVAQLRSLKLHVQELERQRLECASQAATGRMAAVAAHEINNPLASIKNAFALLKDCISEASSRYRYVGMIDNEIRRITFIVRQVFDLYGPDREVAREFSIHTAIRDVVTLLESKLRSHGVQAALEFSSAVESVKLPEQTLRQILFNLIVNAIEASPSGGSITIAVDTAEEHLNIAVMDRGGGIPESMRSSIFEPFVTSKRGHGANGMGLGLNLSRDLVQGLGGALTFECESERGTVFTVKLPGTCILHGVKKWNGAPTS